MVSLSSHAWFVPLKRWWPMTRCEITNHKRTILSYDPKPRTRMTLDMTPYSLVYSRLCGCGFLNYQSLDLQPLCIPDIDQQHIHRYGITSLTSFAHSYAFTLDFSLVWFFMNFLDLQISYAKSRVSLAFIFQFLHRLFWYPLQPVCFTLLNFFCVASLFHVFLWLGMW